MGRPAKGDVGRTVTHSIKLSKVELDAVRSVAESQGVTVSSWIRARILEGLGLVEPR